MNGREEVQVRRGARRPQRLILFDGDSCGGIVFLVTLALIAVGLLILFGGGG